jgi:hypothetical protein
LTLGSFFDIRNLPVEEPTASPCEGDGLGQADNFAIAFSEPSSDTESGVDFPLTDDICYVALQSESDIQESTNVGAHEATRTAILSFTSPSSMSDSEIDLSSPVAKSDSDGLGQSQNAIQPGKQETEPPLDGSFSATVPTDEKTRAASNYPWLLYYSLLARPCDRDSSRHELPISFLFRGSGRS